MTPVIDTHTLLVIAITYHCCSFGLVSDSLLTLYQQYARSHYHHALQLVSLLLLYVLLLSSDPLHVTLLKCYAVILACAAWILAPAIFNPAIRLSASTSSTPIAITTIIDAKKVELRQMWNWLQSPYSVDPSRPSWESWLWEDRLAMIQLRVARIFINTGGGESRRLVHHPMAATAWEVLLRLIEWSPWILLACALIVAEFTLLPTFLLYTVLIVALYASPIPRSMRLAFICTCTILYFASVQIEDATADMMMRVRLTNTQC